MVNIARLTIWSISGLPTLRFFREIGLVFAMNCGLISPLGTCGLLVFWAYFVTAATFLGLCVRSTFNLGA